MGARPAVGHGVLPRVAPLVVRTHVYRVLVARRTPRPRHRDAPLLYDVILERPVHLARNFLCDVTVVDPLLVQLGDFGVAGRGRPDVFALQPPRLPVSQALVGY